MAKVQMRSTSLLSKLLSIGMLIGIISMACSGQQNGKETEAQEQGRILDFTRTVEFLNDDGSVKSTIQVAVAESNEERSEGLMDVRKLEENQGMIFIFEYQQELSFWMANTPLPLDIIFVNENLEIVRIHRNTTPFAQTNYDSEAPAIYTVEVNAGYTITYDINEGDKITLSGLAEG